MNIKYYFSTLLFISLTLNITFSQEICDNGIDDDGDGLIDLNDFNDCSCSVSTEVNNIVPNPSFEINSCCPSAMSQTSCVDNWEKGSNATADYFNTCDFTTGAMPLPLPNGNGAVGIIIEEFYREYIATCLTNPISAGQEYTISIDLACRMQNGFSPYQECTAINLATYGPINFTLYGINSCPSLPTSTNVNECPLVAGWTELGFVAYIPNGNWNTLNITFTPTQNIQAIMLGSPCTVPSTYSPSGFCHPYLFMDNIRFYENSEPVSVSISQNGSYCDNVLSLQANTVNSGGLYQWYYNGIALVGETNSTLSLSAGTNSLGEYTVRYIQGGACGTENFNLDAPCSSLPVELTEFDVVCSDNEISINWTTLSTTNNDYFEIQFSQDGYNYETIIELDGVGNSANQINYSQSLRGEDVKTGYYRLKQVDFDGQNTLSDIVYNNCVINDVIVRIVDGQLVVSNIDRILGCVIFDISGKQVFNSSNITLFRFPKAKAMYFIQIESEKGSSIHKVLN